MSINVIQLVFYIIGYNTCWDEKISWFPGWLFYLCISRLLLLTVLAAPSPWLRLTTEMWGWPGPTASSPAGRSPSLWETLSWAPPTGWTTYRGWGAPTWHSRWSSRDSQTTTNTTTNTNTRPSPASSTSSQTSRRGRRVTRITFQPPQHQTWLRKLKRKLEEDVLVNTLPRFPCLLSMFL